jgi:2-polyprenyl-3-methyl-5-hydroxy-6-metoxy-1,4-benzoquinol methylase
MPKLWEWLLKKYSILSVLDVGCGEGHAMEWFAAHGCQTHGIEGLAENVKACRQKKLSVTQLDLTVGA